MTKLETNLSIVRQRWPELFSLLSDVDLPNPLSVLENTIQPTLLINNIHLTSCYDREQEAWIQSRLIPENSPIAWQYGAGLGDLSRTLLLRPALQKLHVVLMNLRVFKAVLTHFDNMDWLQDERIELHLPEENEDIQVPFCTVPAELKLAENNTKRLSDLLILELDTPFINKRVSKNTRHLHQIEENLSLLAIDQEVKNLLHKYSKDTILVAAAGPTLGSNYQYIQNRDVENTLLISVDAALKPLIQAGIHPDIVVSIDGFRHGVSRLFDCDLNAFKETPLVYFPIVHADIMNSWPGPRYFAYSSSPMYREISERWPGNQLFSAGTVFHAAIDLAVKLGAHEIIMLGADFAFPNNRTHAEGAAYSRPLKEDEINETVVDGYGNQIATSKNLRNYLRDLERYIDQHADIRFINASRSGARINGALYME